MIITGSEGFIGKALKKKYPGAYDVDIRNILNAEDCCDFDIHGETVIHLAAVTGIQDCETAPSYAIRTNISGTQNVARGAERILFASSAAADTCDTLYGITKRAGEDIVRLYCKHHTIMRLSNVYGPGSKDKNSVIAAWCKEAKQFNTITVHGYGTQRRDFIYIDDVAETIAGLMDSNERRVHVCTGELTPLHDAALILQGYTGAKILYKGDPDEREIRQHLPLLKAKTRLEEGLKKTWEYFNEMA